MLKPELIVLWGHRTKTLTVGIVRRLDGYDVVGSVSPDAMRITIDCPPDWQRKVSDAWFALQAGRTKEVAAHATHELEPPRYQSIRPIDEPAEDKP